MKKILVSILVIGLSLSAFSQDVDYSKFSFGLHATPSITWLKTDVKNYSSKGAKLGFGWGVMGDIYFSDKFAISTGANFSKYSGKLNYADSLFIAADTNTLFGNMDRTYKVNYLEIPICLKMKTKEIAFGDNYFNVFALFGIGTNIKLKSKSDDVFTPDDNTLATIEDDNMEATNVLFIRESLIVGLGVEFSLVGSTRLVAGLNYNYGFSDILTSKSNIYTNTDGTLLKENAQFNGLELRIGVLF